MAEANAHDLATAQDLLGAFAAPQQGPGLSGADLVALAPGVALEILRVDVHVSLPPPIAQAFGELAMSLGISEGATLAELEAQFAAHYAKTPVFAAYLAELRRRIRATLATSGPDGTRAAMGALLGRQAETFQSREGAAPKGAVKAQPWARFSLQSTHPKEKK